MGGIEHIPVHHTNEIAQSEAVNGVPLADYWVHNEWLVFNNEKMSKSEGISLTLDDVVKKGFNPLALRFFFMQAHYRSKQNFTWEALEAAQIGYVNLIHKISELGNKIGTVDEDFKKQFSEKIAEDFNSPQALAVLFEMLKADLTNENKLATAFDFDKVLGLKFQEEWKKLEPVLNNMKMDSEVIKLRDEREEARKNKDWEKSDELRNKINNLGYEIKDTQNGPEIRRKQ
jgi:cysteinyl-tRNA synthetase